MQGNLDGWHEQCELTFWAGEWIALVGSGGGLGHLGIQFAKALGLMVVGVDARDEALALSKEAGADVVVDARKGKEDVVKEVHKVTNGDGVHATVNLSEAKDAATTACAITKMHGTMVQIAQVSFWKFDQEYCCLRLSYSLPRSAYRLRSSSSET